MRVKIEKRKIFVIIRKDVRSQRKRKKDGGKAREFRFMNRYTS